VLRGRVAKNSLLAACIGEKMLSHSLS